MRSLTLRAPANESYLSKWLGHKMCFLVRVCVCIVNPAPIVPCLAVVLSFGAVISFVPVIVTPNSKPPNRPHAWVRLSTHSLHVSMGYVLFWTRCTMRCAPLMLLAICLQIYACFVCPRSPAPAERTIRWPNGWDFPVDRFDTIHAHIYTELNAACSLRTTTTQKVTFLWGRMCSERKSELLGNRIRIAFVFNGSSISHSPSVTHNTYTCYVESLLHV